MEKVVQTITSYNLPWDEEFQLDENNNKGTRYSVTQRDIVKFQKIIMQTMARIAQETGKAGQDTLDEILCQRTTTLPTSEAAVKELQAVLDHACRTLFRQTGTINRELRHKSVPWWTT